MANRKVLTDLAVKSLRPAAPGTRYIVADVIVPGLGVRVTDRAHRSYVLGARFPGSARRMPADRHPVLFGCRALSPDGVLRPVVLNPGFRPAVLPPEGGGAPNRRKYVGRF